MGEEAHQLRLGPIGLGRQLLDAVAAHGFGHTLDQLASDAVASRLGVDADGVERCFRRPAAELALVEPGEGETRQLSAAFGGQRHEGARFAREMRQAFFKEAAARPSGGGAVDRDDRFEIAALERAQLGRSAGGFRLRSARSFGRHRSFLHPASLTVQRRAASSRASCPSALSSSASSSAGKNPISSLSTWETSRSMSSAPVA